MKWAEPGQFGWLSRNPNLAVNTLGGMAFVDLAQLATHLGCARQDCLIEAVRIQGQGMSSPLASRTVAITLSL
jgi:hypothetical protein